MFNVLSRPRVVLFLLFAALGPVGAAPVQQDVAAPDLLPIRENGLAGYINREGRVVVAPRFKWAGEFRDGLACVVDGDGRKKFIDGSGEVAFESPFESNEVQFSEGLAVGWLSARSGLIDRKGLLYPLQFDEARSFHEGLAAACVRLPGRGRNGDYWGFIDRHARWTIPVTYRAVGDFSEGLAAAYVGGVRRECTGLEGGKWGFIDKRGALVIRLRYDSVGTFSEGLAAVEVESGKWGYIDARGMMVILPRDTNVAGNFREGLAYVRFPKDGSCGDYGYMNCSRSTSPRVSSAPKSGAARVSWTGSWRIEPQFTEASDFRNGLARVWWDDRIGYIDRDGRIVWRAAKSFRRDLAEGRREHTLEGLDESM